MKLDKVSPFDAKPRHREVFYGKCALISKKSIEILIVKREFTARYLIESNDRIFSSIRSNASENNRSRLQGRITGIQDLQFYAQVRLILRLGNVPSISNGGSASNNPNNSPPTLVGFSQDKTIRMSGFIARRFNSSLRSLDKISAAVADASTSCFSCADASLREFTVASSKLRSCCACAVASWFASLVSRSL